MAQVKVHGVSQDNAVLLLDAAEKAGKNPSAVQVRTDGPTRYFLVDEELAKSAGLDYDTGEEQAEGPFDPSEHSVEEVQGYLESADEAERERVLQAERDGKARKSLVSNEKE